jgi:hypothetical protein
MEQTIPIGLDTPIGCLTPRQLFDMMEERFGETVNQLKDSLSQLSNKPQKWFVYNMKDLATILHISINSMYRLVRTGDLDEAIYQYGRSCSYVIDVNKVFELLQLSNRKRIRKKIMMKVSKRNWDP